MAIFLWSLPSDPNDTDGYRARFPPAKATLNETGLSYLRLVRHDNLFIPSPIFRQRWSSQKQHSRRETFTSVPKTGRRRLWESVCVCGGDCVCMSCGVCMCVKTIFEIEPLNYNSALCITFYLPCWFRIKHNRNFLPQTKHTWLPDMVTHIYILYDYRSSILYTSFIKSHTYMYTIFYIYAALQKRKKEEEEHFISLALQKLSLLLNS